MKNPLQLKLCRLALAAALLLAAATGCAAVRSTAKKELAPVELAHEISVTVAGFRDISKESVRTGLCGKS